MSILSKLQALLTAANTKTGESDTTLTDAVQTLVDGYGSGGGGTPTIGVIETINITEPLSTLAINLNQLALSYGLIKVVFENVQLSISDFVYLGVVGENDTIGDDTGYTGKTATLNDTAYCVFRSSTSDMPGYAGCCFSNTTPPTRRIKFMNSVNSTILKMRLYDSNNTITSGKITIYGRIS